MTTDKKELLPAEGLVHIWSGEHQAYWRQHGGYTLSTADAGVWTAEAARKTTARCGPEKQIELRPARPPSPAPVQGEEEAVSLDMLAKLVHIGRFPEDRAPTRFEDEDRSGREYCYRIASRVYPFVSSPLQGREGYVLVRRNVALSARNLISAMADKFPSVVEDHPEGWKVEACANDLTEALSASPSAPEEWQDISTAPKDGRDILIWMSQSDQQFVAYWNAVANGWSFAQHGGTAITLYDSEEKRWRPLPPPPAAKGDEQ